MRLRITHRTTYLYDEMATDSVNEARITPGHVDRQEVLEHVVEITPPASTITYLDLHGNQVRVIEVASAHTRLDVVATSVIVTTPDTRQLPTVPVRLEDIRKTLSPEEFYEFTAATGYVPLGPELWKKTIDLCADPNDVWATANCLMGYIYEEFNYQTASTSVQTTAVDVLHTKTGVCQDFAHVLLGMLRVRGIPCRYVSGYFWAASIEDDPSAAATHAWVEVYLTGVGWLGLDPTHNRLADDRYVKLAHGRDYSDIRPFAGSYRGSSTREMQVSVRVERLEESGENAISTGGSPRQAGESA